MDQPLYVAETYPAFEIVVFGVDRVHGFVQHFGVRGFHFGWGFKPGFHQHAGGKWTDPLDARQVGALKQMSDEARLDTAVLKPVRIFKQISRIS